MQKVMSEQNLSEHGMHGNLYGMQEKLKDGDIGEALLASLLSSLPSHLKLEDFGKNRIYQPLGIDFRWTFKTNNSIFQVTLDSKYDLKTLETGNVAIEDTVYSHDTKTPKAGCWRSTKADVFAYFVAGTDMVYFIPMRAAKSWLSQARADGRVGSEFIHKKCQNSYGRFGSSLWHANIIPVPLRTLTNEIPSIVAICLKDDAQKNQLAILGLLLSSECSAVAQLTN